MYTANTFAHAVVSSLLRPSNAKNASQMMIHVDQENESFEEIKSCMLEAKFLWRSVFVTCSYECAFCEVSM